ncbi:cupin domain-containing protein [Candidatus Neomarinimicrobiota bacterium]
MDAARPTFIRNLKEIEEEAHYLDGPAKKYRTRRRLAKATGAERIGVNYCRLKKGQISSTFHTHSLEEEFFLLLEGQATLRWGKEEHPLGPGDAVAVLPGGPAHQMRNDTEEDCIFLAIGTRDTQDEVSYPE